MGKTWFEISAKSDIGKKRDTNEDNYFLKSGELNNRIFCMLAVADGMGGLTHGELASTMLIRFLEDYWNKQVYKYISDSNVNMDVLSESIKEQLVLANLAIYNESRQKQITMGTTVSVAFLVDNNYIIIHIGDSRIYKIKKKYATQLTKDHRLVEKNVLTSSVGFYESLKEIYETKGKLKNKDIMLLCTDGFYEYMTEEAMVIHIKKSKSTNELVRVMLKKILASEAKDNITVVAVKYRKSFFK